MAIGRPLKLTPEIRAAFCQQLATGATYETAADALEISTSLISRWLTRGRTQKSGPYAEFFREVRKAKAQVVQRLLARAQKRVMSRKDGGEGADPLPLLAVLDRRYSPQVRVQVTTELNAVLDRLEQEFEREPEILDRILAAIAEEDGPGAVASATGEGRREDARGGAPVGERDADGEAEDVSRAGR